MSTLNKTGGRREASKADKAARIRDAALALWREKGIDATTTREVADRAGIAAGTLFLYVRDKDDLVQFVFRDEITRVLADRVASLRTRAQLLPRLMHLFTGLLEFYAVDRSVSRRLLREILFPATDANTIQFTLEFIGRIAADIASAIERGEVGESKRTAESLAADVFALYLGAVLSVAHGVAVEPACDDLRAAIAHHLRIDTNHRRSKPATRRKAP